MRCVGSRRFRPGLLGGGFCLLLAGLLSGCAVTGDDQAAGEVAPPLPPPAAGEGFQLRGAYFEVQPGEDATHCTFINGVGAFAFRSYEGAQGPDAAHHLAVYASSTWIPDGDADCGLETEFGMADWMFLAGGTKGEVVSYPESTGVVVEESMTIILQAHYVNFEGSVVAANDAINFFTLGEEEVENPLDMGVMLNYDIQVLPGQEYQSTAECTVPGTYQVIAVSGHHHEWGTGFSVEMIRDGQETPLWSGLPLPGSDVEDQVIYYAEGNLLELQPGDVIRWSCSWFNTTDAVLNWPVEMCAAGFIHYPADGGLSCDANQ